MSQSEGQGHLHPITQTTNDIVRIFSEIGFSVATGPEVESEENNFDLLNIPKDHPARDMWDTIWLKEKGKLLRTHTSPVQVRYMKEHRPPIKIIAPGKVYRFEATDATHEVQFYQLEGLAIDEKGKITLAHLKGVLEHFLKEFFGQDIKFRMRPGFFPFVEPGIEVDIQFAPGKWVEILGAGMVHPSVLKAVGIDPEKYAGFAFGTGLDRMVMRHFGIPDVRLLYQGDLRFINQF